MEYVFKYYASMTLNGNSITFFGTQLTESQALTDLAINALYDGTSWNVIVKIDSSESGNIDGADIEDDSIPTAAIADNAVTLSKIETGTIGSLIYYNADGDLAELAPGTANQLPINYVDGTGQVVPRYVDLSGDLTVDEDGVATIPDGTVTKDQLAFTPTSYTTVEVTVPSANVLTLLSSPYQVLGTPTPGYIYDIISATIQMTWNTTAYTQINDLVLKNETASDNMAAVSSSVITTGGGNQYRQFSINDGDIKAGEVLYLTTTGTDPTLGDCDVTVSVVYRQVEIAS